RGHAPVAAPPVRRPAAATAGECPRAGRVRRSVRRAAASRRVVALPSAIRSTLTCLPLGDRALPVEDLIAATLGRVWEEATRIAGVPPGGVTLTHPATWGELRRNALVRAADRAGLPPIELLPEPVAAATAFATVLGHAVPPGSSVVVYDLGAGTFDVSVVRREPAGFRTLATDGLVDVGGLDLDAVMVDLVRRAGRDRHEALWHRLDTPGDLAEQRV